MPAVVVVAFAVTLWSHRTRARKMAQKWGIPDPTSDQVDEVLHYRRSRLACYPLLYVMFGICSGLLGHPAHNQNHAADSGGYPGSPLLLMFLCGAVLAELRGLHRGRQRPVRPNRLRLVDVISRWGAGVYATLILMTFVLGLIDLQAQPHITPSVLRLAHSYGNNGQLGVPITVPFVGTAVILLLVAFVLWSAQSRSFSPDSEIDRGLRIRSARVALGLGIALQLSLLPLSWWRMEFVASYGTGADLVPTGPESFGLDPAAVSVRDWAQKTADLVEPWTFLSVIVAVFTWIYVANPDSRGFRTLRLTKA
ncbi:hypothetical protein [Saccharopolyspora mangrovi]|uniref:DUF1648 domain-containing protein n=1 Tax=Saccharopolyspora mangrovi TaxID=3082379 RepID=A0ABU6A8R7_9PSEU|nr:hypothetical protein [Saccharopolyspora sp. S2-29]MEB3367770.1 hypothetical protein [Saccharopolyspora sp. S2-29]